MDIPPGWAREHMLRLRRNETVSFRPWGASMRPLIESGQLVTVEPVDPATLVEGDIVLCLVGRAHYLHLVKNVESGRFLIGNNRGRINGWIEGEAVFGRCVSVVD